MIGVVGFHELLNGGSPSSNKSFYSYLMVFIEMLIQLFLENTKAKLIFHREVLIESMFFCLDAYFGYGWLCQLFRN